MKNSPIGCRFTRKIPSLDDEKVLLGHNPVTENSSAPPPVCLIIESGSKMVKISNASYQNEIHRVDSLFNEDSKI